MDRMKRKLVTGLAWTYAERILAQMISLIVTIVLARIISPDEYGIIAIVSIFINIADTFAISGLGNALIQKKEADHLDFSSVFYFNTVFSLFLYIVLFFAAKPIAFFYNNVTLIPVLRIMSIRIPIAAINSVQQAYVSRRMEFKRFFWATLFGTLVSAIIGIMMAYKGFGVWSLVSQYMSNTIIDTIVLWCVVRWRPRWEYSWTRMGALFSYGWKVLATSLLITVYGNIQDLVIGKKFSTEDLAYSNKGRQFPNLIASNVNTSISKVLFPAMSSVQDERPKIKALTRKSISMGTYILSPILVGLAAISESFVSIFLTEKWLPCVPYLQIMCLVFLLQPIQTASIQAMKALGKSDIYLKLEIIKKLGGIVILITSIFCFHSVLAIVVGSLIAEIFSTVVNLPINKNLLNYSYREQLNDIIETLFISLLMLLIVRIIGSFIVQKYMKFIIQIIVGGLSYIALSSFNKNINYLYLKNLVKDIFYRNKEEKNGL